jgi:hypothetical protein
MALYFLIVRFPSVSSNEPESKGRGSREYPFYQTESEDAAHVFLELFKDSAAPASIWDGDTAPGIPVYDLCYGEGLSAAERVRYRSAVAGLKDRRDPWADPLLPAIRLFDHLKAHHDRAIEWEPAVMEEVFKDLSKRAVAGPPNIGPHFLTARFPVAILQRNGQKIPKEEADLIYEKEDHVFYETGSRVVAEHVVKMLRHGEPEPDEVDFFSTKPIFRVRPGWPLEVPQRILYRQALEQLAAINEAPDDLDCLSQLGLPTDPRSLWLWALYKEAKQLERLVLDELPAAPKPEIKSMKCESAGRRLTSGNHEVQPSGETASFAKIMEGGNFEELEKHWQEAFDHLKARARLSRSEVVSLIGFYDLYPGYALKCYGTNDTNGLLELERKRQIAERAIAAEAERRGLDSSSIAMWGNYWYTVACDNLKHVGSKHKLKVWVPFDGMSEYLPDHMKETARTVHGVIARLKALMQAELDAEPPILRESPTVTPTPTAATPHAPQEAELERQAQIAEQDYARKAKVDALNSHGDLVESLTAEGHKSAAEITEANAQGQENKPAGRQDKPAFSTNGANTRIGPYWAASLERASKGATLFADDMEDLIDFWQHSPCLACEMRAAGDVVGRMQIIRWRSLAQKVIESECERRGLDSSSITESGRYCWRVASKGIRQVAVCSEDDAPFNTWPRCVGEPDSETYNALPDHDKVTLRTARQTMTRLLAKMRAGLNTEADHKTSERKENASGAVHDDTHESRRQTTTAPNPPPAPEKQGEPAAISPDDGSPFYKPSYFAQWDIGDEQLRRRQNSGKKYVEGKVRRKKQKPVSGKAKRPVYWYSEPDARKCWPHLFVAK